MTYPGPFSAQDVLDIIARYHPRVNPRDFGPEGEHEPAFRKYVQNSPEFKAWRARVDERFAALSEWRDFIRKEVQPRLPELLVYDQTPGVSVAYEVHIGESKSALVDGDIDVTLIGRVSHLASVYEIYELRVRIVKVGPENEDVKYKDRHYTHDISSEFQPVADVLAQVIEERFGYQRLGPKILDSRLVYLTVPGYYVNDPTIGNALFGQY